MEQILKFFERITKFNKMIDDLFDIYLNGLSKLISHFNYKLPDMPISIGNMLEFTTSKEGDTLVKMSIVVPYNKGIIMFDKYCYENIFNIAARDLNSSDIDKIKSLINKEELNDYNVSVKEFINNRFTKINELYHLHGIYLTLPDETDEILYDNVAKTMMITLTFKSN